MSNETCIHQSQARPSGDSEATRAEQLVRALELLRAAIALLDAADAPGEIAAHVDLALHQLDVTIRS